MQPHRLLSPLGAALLLAAALPAVLRAQGPTIPGDAPPALPNGIPALPPGTPPSFPGGVPPPPPNRVPPRLPPNVRFNAPGTVPGAVPGPLVGEENVRLQFPNAAVTDILDHYALLTGKRVLADNTVQGQINIMVNQPVPKSEAIRIIEVALSLNGFTLVPAGDNIIKVLGLGKQPRNEGVPIFSELDQLPADTEQIVSFLFRPNYLDPQETAGALQQYVPPVNRAAFTALEKAGALIITDTAASVRRLVALLKQLDQPAAAVVERPFRLERADATKAVEFLNTLFDTKNASAGNGAAASGVANTRRPLRRVGEEGVPNPDQAATNPVLAANGGLPTLSGDSVIQGRLTLTADIRTNTVYVITSPVNLPLIERLLQEYDADTPFADPVRRVLRYVIAKDVLPILVQTLAEPGTETNGGSSGTSNSNGNSTGRTSVNGSSTSSNSSNPFSSLSGSNSSSGSSGFGGTTSGSGNSVGDSGLDTPAVDTTPAVSTVGNTKIIADPRSNTIIVLGGGEARDKINATLDQLDVRAPQVIIRTVIGELTLNKDSELGFNYLLRSNRGSLLSAFAPGFTGTTTSTTTGTTGTTTTTGTGTTTTSSQLSSLTDLATGLASVSSSFNGVGGILAIGKSFEIILSALESTNRFKTISRPMIFTSNNKKAIIASGEEIAVPTQSVGTTGLTTGNSVATATNVDYKDVTLQLEVVPLINSDHEVTLDILQKIDNVVPNASTTIGNINVPTISTRYLKSTVSAPNNSTIVLGGLITQDESKTAGDIPYLGKIPVLGALFRSRSTAADRSELIILMHPEVVNTPDLVVQARKNEDRRTYLGGGLEQQLLPMEVRKAIPVKQAKTTTTVAPK